MEYLRRAWAEIHLDRIADNFRSYRNALGDDTEIMCVVKADCYGHCDRAIAPYLQNKLGVRWFAVSNLEEAQRLRDIGIVGEILILGYTPPEAAKRLCSLNIIQTITEAEYADDLCKHIADNKKVRVHIAIDTGMTRIGLHSESINEIKSEVKKILNYEKLTVEGMFTHLSVADSDSDDDKAYTSMQIDKILELDKSLRADGIALNKVHFFNSAGGIYHNNSKSSFARLGIILYGLMPNAALALPCKLSPVMELKARIAQVKNIDAGEYISYGRTFKAEKPMRIATVTIGYADGFSRLLSNIGELLIGGKRTKIVGRVCMDQLMCDVTEIDAKANDVVTLIGTDGDETITADDLAGLYGTIGYEIVCGISKRVPRVVIENGNEISVFQD